MLNTINRWVNEPRVGVKMGENLIETSAPWVTAIGTIMSAIGSTPFERIDEDYRNALNLWGNVLQASGNALQADVEEEISLSKIGNEIQAVGNITVVSGMVIKKNKKETQEKLIITGNWFQALGGLLAVADDIEQYRPNQEPDPATALDVIGNLLQSIGNSMQAIGGIEELKGNDEYGEKIEINGSWIQAVGSVLTALASTKTIENEQKSE